MSENKPIKKFGAGVISASIWKNELKDGSTVFAVTIERRYQNKGGDWQSTSNLRMNDLPKVREGNVEPINKKEALRGR